jgi:hypothetical protein
VVATDALDASRGLNEVLDEVIVNMRVKLFSSTMTNTSNLRLY